MATKTTRKKNLNGTVRKAAPKKVHPLEQLRLLTQKLKKQGVKIKPLA